MKRFNIIICLVLLLSSVQAYDTLPQSSADLKFCTGYSALSQSQADLQYSDSCAAVANTCVYTSGDWTIDCSENCVISADTDVGGNNILFDGDGTIFVDGNVTNWAVGRIQNSCVVRQRDGGLIQ